MNPLNLSVTASVLCALCLPYAAPADAGVIYDESISGDLSGAFASPDALSVSVGANTVVAQVGQNGNTGATNGSDADYFSITIGAGQSLTGINVDSYVSSGNNGSGSFFGYRDQPFINQSTVSGFTIFSAGSGDVLPAISGGNALGPGTYNFWVQETLSTVIDYELTFTVTPEPSSLALLGLGGLVIARRRR